MRPEYPIWILCCALQVSVSGYHNWKNRLHQKSSKQNLREVAAVRAAHKKHAVCTAHCGYTGSFYWQVKKIHREEGLTITHSQKRICTTKSNRGEPVAENVLNRQFVQHAPNRVWVSDITYIPTAEGWLYLAGIKRACAHSPAACICRIQTGSRTSSALRQGKPIL